MTASSHLTNSWAWEGRLNNKVQRIVDGVRKRIKSWGSWCPDVWDMSPWLQVGSFTFVYMMGSLDNSVGEK